MTPAARARHAYDAIFHARSVAVIGASANPGKLNGAPIPILRMTGFPGPIYPVNPKYHSIDGLRCYPDVSSLPETPDVVLILVPAADVPGVLEACGRMGVRAAVVVSSGFEEVEDSAALVAAMKSVCARHGIALIGPNCEGVWSVRSKVLLTFGSAARREHLVHAPIAMLSQSGSLAGAVARHLQDDGFGCAYIVSVGNETIVSLLDILEYMIEQDDVRVILLFLEGLKDGERLVRLADRAHARGMVLAALKSGNSTAGQAAVASHTGKMTTTHAIYRDVFEQAGIIAVASLVELIEAAEVLSSVSLPTVASDHHDQRGGVGVFSIPGGTRALTADLCETHQVPLASFGRETVSALEAVLPSFGVATNPTDVTGQVLSHPDLFERALRIIARDAGTTSLVVQLANRGPTDAARYKNVLAETARQESIPVIVSFLGDTLGGPERADFARDGIGCARDPADAIRYASWLYQAARIAGRATLPAATVLAPAQARGEPATRLHGGWAGAMQLLGEAGIAAPPWVILPPGHAFRAVATDMRFPVALKALPEQAEHKTEKGLLRLNLASASDVDDAARALRVVLHDATAPLLAQEMAPAGVECVLSVLTDSDFGTIVALGSGGVFVELWRDVGYLSAPCSAADVERAIDGLTLATLLQGFRGAPPADRRALVQSVLGLVRAFAARSGELSVVEINPLIVLPANAGVIAVDVLIKQQPRTEPPVHSDSTTAHAEA